MLGVVMMSAMCHLKPDVPIDGIELSPKLADQARINNATSGILCGNIIEMDILYISNKYNYFFSAFCSIYKKMIFFFSILIAGIAR